LNFNKGKEPMAYHPGSGPQLAGVVTKTPQIALSMMLHTVVGWGKTSFGAQIPGAIFLMVGNEIGLRTLMSRGILSDVPHFPNPATTANEVRLAINELLVHEHNYKTLVIDVFNEVERLYFQEAAEKSYNGDMDKFLLFEGGPRAVAKNQIPELLGRLDELRIKRGMSIVLLNHTATLRHKNPMGDDYDYYAPALSKPTIDAVSRWADAIFFGMHEVYTTTDRARKTKATGGEHRIIKTEFNAAYLAKNRLNLTDDIDGGSSAREAWANFLEAVKKAKPPEAAAA
jgi:hypothetical protein